MRDDCGHSLRGAQTGKMRDKTDIRFSYFAHAAFVRACSTNIAATQRFSPKRPFERVEKGRNQTALSLRLA